MHCLDSIKSIQDQNSFSRIPENVQLISTSEFCSLFFGAAYIILEIAISKIAASDLL